MRRGLLADLVAQAEHDPEALAVLITSQEQLAEEVVLEVKRQSQTNEIAQQSLAAQGFAFVTASVDEARELTNKLAPEHLTVDAGRGCALGEECRQRVHWQLCAAVDGRLHQWTEPCTAHRPQRPCARRIERTGLCEGDYCAAVHAGCAA